MSSLKPKHAGWLVAAGALASIATSVAMWTVTADAILTPGTLDLAHPSVRYVIRAEAQGPGPFKDFGGTLWVDVMTQARPSPTVPTTVTLRSLSSEPFVEQLAVDTWASRVSGGTQLWRTCAEPPCVEEWELVIEVDPAQVDRPVFDITGTVQASADGTGEEPRDTHVILTVTGPL